MSGNNPGVAANATPVWPTPPINAKVTPIVGAATTVVKTGAGYLALLLIGTPVAAATIKLYDGVDNTGILLTTITLAAGGPSVLPLSLPFTVGLVVVTSGATDLTLVTA